MMFIHLHTHSYYSFLEGLPSPEELALQAVQYHMPALALTDHLMLTGAVEFYQACNQAGIRPIIGLDLDIKPDTALLSSFPKTGPGISSPGGQVFGSLVLLAIDLDGWGNLCRLSSLLGRDKSLEGIRGLPLGRLAENTSGLICLSGGTRGWVTKLLRIGQQAYATRFLANLKNLFPHRLYVELQYQAPDDKGMNYQLVMLARKLKCPFVATGDVYYLRPEQSRLQRVLSAIRQNKPVKNLPKEVLAPLGSHFASPEEMQIRFEDYPEALEVTHEIASRCQLELPLDIPHYPEIDLPAGVTAIQMLRQEAESGAKRLYGQASRSDGTLPSPVSKRLNHELEVIDKCGYAPLFLIMEEIVRFTREKSIPISSRGSAASSLVAHCLGITSPDPIRLNLYFERFLNPARLTPPDIDTDLCSRRRDEVIRFVSHRYGSDRVAMVATVNRFRPRSALREVAKAHGLAPVEVKSLAERLPVRWWHLAQPGSRSESPYAELSERFTSPLHQKIFRDAEALWGIPRHLSVHPGGVVITPGPLTDLVPITLAAKGVVITQFDLEAVEQLGLVKIDLLGIRGLTVLGDVADAIRKADTKTPPIQSLEGISGSISSDSTTLQVLESIPGNDPVTADLVKTGRTIGCFQIESPGMRATLKEIRASSIDDLMIALALYRPGPLTGGLKEAFVRRHRGEEEVSQIHPALKPLLEDTQGVILYQEQVLQIAHDLAGLSLADADLLRRAMSHFDPGEQMKTLKEKFIRGARTHSDVPEEIGEAVWDLMAAFAGYGFPKAHAASYAQLSWRAAWCKAHFPAVFMAAVLANWGGYYRQSGYLMEARRMGLELAPPLVNYAKREFSVSSIDGKEVLVMGLDQVRELTRRTQKVILTKRPFYSLGDFLERVDPRSVEVENLVKVGALEGFGTIPLLLDQIRTGGWRARQLRLFSTEGDFAPEAEKDWSLEEKVAAQQAILGVSVVAHPLEMVAERITNAGAISTTDAAASLGKQVRVAGMRQTWRRSRTTRGDYIYFMSLEDLDGMLDIVLFSDVHRRYRKVFSGPGPYVIEGVVEMNETGGEPFIRAEKAWRLGGN
jgi:DNA polymerase-3 subunit alpha